MSPEPRKRAPEPRKRAPEPRKRAPEPRKRDAVATRARILAAAYELFSGQGYARTGMREIAALAEVAPSLVARYFVTKAALFEESLVHAIHAEALFVREKPGFGRRMARLIHEANDTRLTAMTVLAIADAEAQAVAQRVAARHIIAPLAEWLGPPDAHARAVAMFALMTGFTMQLRLAERGRVPPATVRWLAATLQDIVDG